MFHHVTSPAAHAATAQVTRGSSPAAPRSIVDFADSSKRRQRLRWQDCPVSRLPEGVSQCAYRFCTIFHVSNNISEHAASRRSSRRYQKTAQYSHGINSVSGTMRTTRLAEGNVMPTVSSIFHRRFRYHRTQPRDSLTESIARRARQNTPRQRKCLQMRIRFLSTLEMTQRHLAAREWQQQDRVRTGTASQSAAAQ